MTASNPDDLTSRLRALEGKLWTREYLMKIAVFDGATIAPENGAAARGDAMGALAGEPDLRGRRRVAQGEERQRLGEL